MRKIVSFLTAVALYIVTALACVAQDITGSWAGKLNAAPGVSIELIFNISAQADGGLRATMDSPQEGARGIPMDNASFENGTLVIESKSLSLTYKGIYLMGVINGKLAQHGMEMDLILSRQKIEKPQRPQTPSAPFPYSEEEVSFVNTHEEGVSLAGTLTMPKNKEKLHAVVLISGSGAQNRDEELFDHKPFAVIADYLTREGLAVLRYDDRGVGASKGESSNATSVNFMYDAEAAVDYLLSRPEIAEVSVLGHSEGGMIAYMIAARRNDIASIVSLAGPAVSGRDVLIEQTKAALRTQGIPDALIEQTSDLNTQLYDLVVETKNLSTEEYGLRVRAKLKELLGSAASTEIIEQYAGQLDNEWMRYFICYDPSKDIKNVKCPILFMNGTKDCQVLSFQNVPAMKALTAGRSDVRIEEMEGLNHIFQEANTGAVSEYYEIEQTMSPKALKMIAGFLKQQ